MTRRPVKPQPDGFVGGPGVFTVVKGERVPAPLMPYRDPKGKEKYSVVIECPYGQPGDRLWVRETWGVKKAYDGLSPSKIKGSTNHQVSVGYKTDPPGKWAQTGCAGAAGKWRPSIHMPRWASRILLEITSVGVERIQNISLAEIKAEGIDPLPRADVLGGDDYGYPFIQSWNAIYPGSWDRNDWVWVIEFKRVSP